MSSQDPKVDFLTDNEGHQSAMRAMAFISLLAAIGFSGVMFWNLSINTEKKWDFLNNKLEPKTLTIEQINALKEIDASNNGTEMASLIWAFLAAAFGGKAVQKIAENTQSDQECDLEPNLANQNNSNNASPKKNSSAVGSRFGP